MAPYSCWNHLGLRMSIIETLILKELTRMESWQATRKQAFRSWSILTWRILRGWLGWKLRWIPLTCSNMNNAYCRLLKNKPKQQCFHALMRCTIQCYISKVQSFIFCFAMSSKWKLKFRFSNVKFGFLTFKMIISNFRVLNLHLYYIKSA